MAGAIDRPGCGTVVVPTGVGMSGLPAPVATLHPALWTGALYESELMDLLYRPLIWVGPGLTIDWSDSLASGVATNADDTVFTIALKPFAWSDGSAVTAADVLYDWSLIRSLGEAYSQFGVGGVPTLVRAVKAIDPSHVEFDLTQPLNPQLFELSGLTQFYALPQQAWARYDLSQQQSLQSEVGFYDVVDGPFRLDSLSLGRHAVLVPNTRYSGHRASIRRLVVDFLQGIDPIEALDAREVDMASLPFELWQAAGTLRDIDRMKMGSTPVFSVITPNLTNPADPFFDDVRVRQAIARAIDQQRIVTALFHGQARLQAGVISSAFPDLLPPDLRDGRSPLSHDPAAARALLDAAGWKPGADGVRVKGGRRLAFSVLTSAGSAAGLIILQLVEADLAKVGIALSIKQVEFNQLIARMLGPTGGWDATTLAYTAVTYPDPTQFLQTGASENYEHYSNPAMDRLLAEAQREKGHQALFAVEDYAVMQQPLFFLPEGSYTVLVRPGIQGLSAFLSSNGNWSPEYLSLRGAMACH